MITLIKHGFRDVPLKIVPSVENPNVLRITRVSDLTGKEHTMELPVTESQLRNWLDGRLIQDVMPHLSREQREFLISGCSAEEWDKFVKTEDD